MFGITVDFWIVSVVKDAEKKEIKIHLKYLAKHFKKDDKEYKLDDHSPEREWQHLSWFEYRCYLACSLPRYISEDGTPKVIDVNVAGKSYTHLFAAKVIVALQKMRVQSAVSSLFQTSAYIVRRDDGRRCRIRHSSKRRGR